MMYNKFNKWLILLYLSTYSNHNTITLVCQINILRRLLIFRIFSTPRILFVPLFINFDKRKRFYDVSLFITVIIVYLLSWDFFQS